MEKALLEMSGYRTLGSARFPSKLRRRRILMMILNSRRIKLKRHGLSKSPIIGGRHGQPTLITHIQILIWQVVLGDEGLCYVEDSGELTWMLI